MVLRKLEALGARYIRWVGANLREKYPRGVVATTAWLAFVGVAAGYFVGFNEAVSRIAFGLLGAATMLVMYGLFRSLAVYMALFMVVFIGSYGSSAQSTGPSWLPGALGLSWAVFYLGLRYGPDLDLTMPSESEVQIKKAQREWEDQATKVDEMVEGLEEETIEVGEVEDDDLVRVKLDKLYDLTPYQFEHLVARVLRKQGYNCEVLPAARDKGADVIAKKGGVTTLVEVKQHRNPVGRPVLQKARGAMTTHDADRLMVACLGGFRSTAQEDAEKGAVQLLDDQDLVAEVTMEDLKAVSKLVEEEDVPEAVSQSDRVP